MQSSESLLIVVVVVALAIVVGVVRWWRSPKSGIYYKPLFGRKLKLPPEAGKGPNSGV